MSGRSQRWRSANLATARAASRDNMRRRRLADPAGERARARKYRAANKTLLNRLKSAPCSDCAGSFPPVCMDFDHRPETKKIKAVSLLMSCRTERVLAEIAKCDLVCANCHRIRTATRFSGAKS